MRNLLAALGAVAFMLVLSGAALAADAAPAAGVFDGLISLYGPTLGVITALVLFFDRLAKVIPNSTTSTALTVIRKVAAVLGAKVPDVQ